MPGIAGVRSLQRARTLWIGVLCALALALPGATMLRSAGAAAFSISSDDLESLSGATAVVSHSDNGANLRAKPGLDGEVLDTLPDGTVVSLRVDEVDTVSDDTDRWWPVSFDGTDGWIAGSYLEASDQPASSSGNNDDSAAAADASGFTAGDLVSVNTDGLAMRNGPSVDDDRVASLGEGDEVTIEDGPFLDDDGDSWYLVNDGDFSAYVFGAYLELSGTSGDSSSDDGGLGPGDLISPEPGSGGVFVRSRPSVNSRRLDSISEGHSVEIIDGPTIDRFGDGWYQVQDGDITGYMFSAYIVDASTVPAVPDSGPTGTFMYPLSSFVLTQGYGCTGLSLEPWNPQLGCYFHNGIDMAAPAYTPIMAADGGTVVAAGWCDCGLGFYVEIDHGNGYSTMYGHMAEQPYVSVGQEVNQGDVIGPVGSTGASTGPHVHFILKVNGSTVDPRDYI